MADSRACLRCEGVKTLTSPGFTSMEGKVYPTQIYRCVACDGVGTFFPPAMDSIVAACLGRPKRGRPTLRSKRPDDARAYHVWRWARFHGGLDVTLPMGASMGTRSDPFRADLDAMAETLAKIVCGTDLAGTARWASALHGTAGESMVARLGLLPASAYASGPVVMDSNKPEEEQPELH